MWEAHASLPQRRGSPADAVLGPRLQKAERRLARIRAGPFSFEARAQLIAKSAVNCALFGVEFRRPPGAALLRLARRAGRALWKRRSTWVCRELLFTLFCPCRQPIRQASYTSWVWVNTIWTFGPQLLLRFCLHPARCL